MNKVDWSGCWATPWGSAIGGTKAKTITSCDNAFVTNFMLAQGSSALRESKATATKRPAGTEINHTRYGVCYILLS